MRHYDELLLSVFSGRTESNSLPLPSIADSSSYSLRIMEALGASGEDYVGSASSSLDCCDGVSA